MKPATCSTRRSIARQAALAGAVALMSAGGAAAQIPPDQVPEEMQGVEIVQRLDEMLPLDLTFTDHNGREVTLQSYFNQGKPVILTPIFYECPMLCSLILNGLVDGLNRVEGWTAGREFQIVTFSFDPGETAKLANLKRRAYFTQYRREVPEDGWPFLVGSEQSIAALTDAVGFHYRYDPKTDTYAHSASITIITPDGRISRYFNDVMFQPRDLRLALIEASEGRIGSPIEKFLLFTCFAYDPERGSYVASAWKVMRSSGIVTIVVIVLGVVWLVRRGPGPDREKKRTMLFGGLQS